MRGNNCIWLLLLLPALNAFSTDLSANQKNHTQYVFPDSNKVKLAKDTAKKDSTNDDDIKHRRYEIGLNGASDQGNHGLHNKNTKLPYLEPNFTYYAKSGFYIETSDQFLLVKKEGGFDVFGLNPGWDFDPGENTTVNLNYQYYGFKKKTPNEVSSSLGNDIESYIEHYIGNLEGKFTADYNIYTQQNKNQAKTPNDIIFTPDIQYDFEIDFGKKSSIDIIPEANIAFGTRNFYTQYLDNAASDSSSNNLNPKKASYSANSNASFGTVDYEFLLSIEYTIGKFCIEPSFAYSHPLYNSSSVPSTPLIYGSISLTYTLKSKK